MPVASTSAKAVAMKSVLTPVMTLKGHGEPISSISYFPDGRRMISGSHDNTARRWDLKAGKEIEEARVVCAEGVQPAVAVSRDGRWVVTGDRDGVSTRGELKACEVETGIVKTFKGHSQPIRCIDISADSKLLASGSDDYTARIWNLETGKLVAGPFESVGLASAVRFSTDSNKLAKNSNTVRCLEVWDVQKQKLDVRIGKFWMAAGIPITFAPIFWTNKDKNILAAFSFTEDDPAKTIYVFDASTLEHVGAPFKGHTKVINSLALSSDSTLLASASSDYTIKLWAFESRQLLASFDVQNASILVLSPDSCQLAYCAISYWPSIDHNIYICNTPPNVLAKARTNARTINNLLNSDATRRPPAGRRRPPMSLMPTVQRPPPAIDPQPPMSLRLRKLLRFSSRTNAVHPVQLRNPLDVPATLPLPSSLSGQPATRFDRFEISSPPPPSNGPVTQFLRQHLSFLVPRHSHGPPVVEVAPGRAFKRLVAANLPEYKKRDDTRHPPQAGVPHDIDTSDIDSLPDVHWCKAFLCYCSCWSHGRPRMPPRWRLERVDVPRQNSATNGSRSSARGRG